MTRTDLTPAVSDPPRPHGPRHRAPLAGSPLGWAGLWLAGTLGSVLIAVAFSLAARSGTDTSHYAVFWLGVILMFLPTAIVVTGRHTGDRVRWAWLLAYGLFTYLPKLLRNPGQPLFHDEVAHWRQTVDLAGDGHLFRPNYLIGIVAHFPGLHILTASVADATGLTAWQSAAGVMIVAHVLAVLGAFLLGETLLGGTRAGAMVALIYSLNASFLYFDTEFAYESLAMPLFLWCLACLARAQRSTHGRERAAWGTAAALTGLGVVPTHHLTAVILSVLLVLLTAVTVTAAARGGVPSAAAKATATVTVAVVAPAAAWLLLVAPSTFAYLSPYLGGGTSQLLHLFSSKGASRSLFQASTEPFYEKDAAFTVPLLAFVLAVVAIRQWWKRTPAERRSQPMRRGLGLFGLLYFPSLPFILVEFGAEGARRTWGFTYIGLAVLITPVVLAGIDRLDRFRGRVRAGLVAVVCLIACDALVGNVAAGLDPDYRFPGPFVFGSDTRSMSAELVGTSTWFKDHIGTRLHVVSDRYTGLSLVRDADALPAAPGKGFPTYDLYFDSAPPSAFLVHELSSSDYTYLIIDKRMSYELPAIGVYFEPDEPFAYDGRSPISAQDLDRYNNLPWTTKVYESDDYAVYRFDFAAIHDNLPKEAR